jgi:very-short-patch-repair endonuclease
MPHKNIITHQSIHPELQKRAKEMRRNMTPAERKLWQHLRANRLEGFHFRRQQIIDRFIVDFYCHAADLVIEVDGGSHLEQEAYDQERDAYLAEHGLKVLRFLNTEVEKEMESVLTAILQACREGRGTE